MVSRVVLRLSFEGICTVNETINRIIIEAFDESFDLVKVNVLLEVIHCNL
jgi:hypothetical protein